jgi:transcriptional regulator with XRE-family HTH domain
MKRSAKSRNSLAKTSAKLDSANASSKDVGHAGAELMGKALGSQIRLFRSQLNLTIGELAKRAALSPGMLSKIETGAASPSLETLGTLARALNVPVTALFRKYEEEREAAHIKAGHGASVDRPGSKFGLAYRLLGHPIKRSRVSVEPCLVTIKDATADFSSLQHNGVEFIYLLEGKLVYRHGQKTYLLNPGDSLFFDGDITHGPQEAVKRPVRFLSMIVQPRFDD